MKRGGKHETGGFDVPARVIEAMRLSQKNAVLVPRAMDKAIVEAATIQLQTVATPGRTPLPNPTQGQQEEAPDSQKERLIRLDFTRWAAVAAMLVLMAVVLVVLGPRGSHRPGLARDFNGDGRVDILDALALARSIQTEEHLSSAWDLNKDGRVDQLDAATIAESAVKLEPEGGA